MSNFDAKGYNRASSTEQQLRESSVELFRSSPLPNDEVLANLPLYVNRQTIARMLFLQHVYALSLEVHGVIMEFGVRWGRDLAYLQALRGIYEPYNHTRRIVGFDTFEGFVSIATQDGEFEHSHAGAYTVSLGYEQHLSRVLQMHEAESPISHMKKFELRKGDVAQTLKSYLADNPQTIVSLAYFDLDLYEPTKAALELIRPYLTKGSVLAFDELNISDFPGETVALRELLGLDRYAIRRWPHHSAPSYLIID